MENESKVLFESEKQLLSLIRQGRQEALGELYQRYYRILFSYSYKISGDKELSRDCVHDLFLDLWNDKEKLAQVMRLRPYLLQAVWNNTIKLMKKAQKKVHWDPDRPYRTEVVFSIEQLIIQHQLNKDQQDSLRIALESLPARQKQILFMIYYEGLSIAEISEITSLQYQSIRNFTHRALVKLREILGSIVFFLMTVLS